MYWKADTEIGLVRKEVSEIVDTLLLSARSWSPESYSQIQLFKLLIPGLTIQTHLVSSMINCMLSWHPNTITALSEDGWWLLLQDSCSKSLILAMKTHLSAAAIPALVRSTPCAMICRSITALTHLICQLYIPFLTFSLRSLYASKKTMEALANRAAESGVEANSKFRALSESASRRRKLVVVHASLLYLGNSLYIPVLIWQVSKHSKFADILAG